MAMSRRWRRAVSWAAVAALGAGLVSSVVLAQQRGATVTAYGFELSCDANVSEGSTLACTLSNTSDEAADWPAVGIVHLSSDDDRALVVGSPVDVAFGVLEGSPETEDDVWWIGDVLVGYSRFDWDGQATASSESGTTDSRTVNIVVADDTAWEQAESFYVALAPSGARGVGFLYDSRQKITIPQSDSKSSDATLASLVISAGGTTTDLTPPPSRHLLTAEYTTTELTVAPTATYKPSGISVAVDSGAAYSFAAESGDETRAIPLAVGINTISVTVTAENGTSSEAYEVMVTRASLVDGATVTASSDGFSLTCPGTVAEGSTMECTLTNLSTSPADWPVVAFLHSSADGSRALIAEDPIIPESSLLYSQDIRLTDPQVAAVDYYNYGYGELFSGGSRSVYATYGFEKFDWLGPAEASTSRNVFVEILADDLDEGDEIFYAAIADSGYTGLPDLVDNKVPIVVRGTSSVFPVEAIGKNGAADVFWTGLDAIDGEPVTSYDLRYIRSDATDRSDGSWEVRTSIWRTGDGVLAFELSGLVNDVSYDIQLRAVAGTTIGPWSTTQTVTPRLSNQPPAFPDTETGQRSVVEGAIAGRSVGAPISATDPEGDTLLYSLQSGGDVFDIRAATGQLSTKAELDYETAATHSVVVAVSDGKDLDGESDPAVDATVEVTVSVIDVNEPPAFPDTETGQHSVVEGAIAGRSVGAPISATDPEGDTLLYSLQSGGDVFDIRAATGQLSTKAELDYETAATHSVVVAVSDGKDLDGEFDPAVDATVEVTVSVIDVNEPPAFPDTETGQHGVVEGAIAGRSVGAPISATDPEGDTLLYSLQSGGDVFDIRAATGQLSTKAELDYETAATHSVVVAVSDGKDLDGESDPAVDATVEVTVSVIDVNEPPALSGPSAVEFRERSGDSVGAYAALDPDGDELSWSLGGADAASFKISAEGVLRFLSPPDFDAAGDADGDNAYEVQVRVTDGKNAAGEFDPAVDATVEVTVSVIDVNEPPALSGPSAVEFRERSGDSVGAYAALDPDGDELSWSLGGADAASFKISAEGVLRFLSPPDFDAAGDADGDNAYEVQVRVTDGKNAAGEFDPAVDATVEVTVSVIDVNWPPALSGPSAVDFLDRSTFLGDRGNARVGAYAAFDLDGDELSWSLGGADAASFEISAEGVLRFLSPPDFDAAGDADGDNAYEVQVRVTDGKNAAGESDPAVDASIDVTVSVAPPKAVTGLDLRSNALGEITVSWDAVSPAPTEYLVVWTPADKPFLLNPAGTAFSSSTSHLLTGLNPAVVYKVTVITSYSYAGVTGTTQRRYGFWGKAAYAMPTGEGAPDPVPQGTALAGVVSAGSMTYFGPTAVGYARRVGQFNVRYLDSKVFNAHRQLVALLHFKGTTSLVGEVSLKNPVILSVSPSYPHSVHTPFILEVDGRKLASTQAVVPEGQTSPNGKYWLWENPCVDWQVGDTLEMRIVAVDDSDPRLLAKTDAALGSLSLDGISLISEGSAPAITQYTLAVTPGVDQITVVAEAADRNVCELAITPGDADDTADGHQIHLGDGDVTIEITVTAGDGHTSREYVVNVDVRSSTFERRSDLDLTGLGNSLLRGLWSDGTTLWVADASNTKLLAFDIATGERQRAKEFPLAVGPGFDDYNITPSGIWSDGSTMWVADYSGRVFAYDLATGQRQPTREFDDVLGGKKGQSALDIWSDSSTMWISNFPDGDVFAYSMETRTRQPHLDIPAETMRAEGNTLPSGLWSDGLTIWIGDSNNDKVYAYDLLTGERQAHSDFYSDPDSVDSASPHFLWSDPSTMWLVDDRIRGRIFAYGAG